MKRIICLILTFALCASLPLAALAVGPVELDEIVDEPKIPAEEQKDEPSVPVIEQPEAPAEEQEDEPEELTEDNTILNFCTDVKPGDAFCDAILWAYMNDVCKGVDDVHFAPNDSVTRAQVITYLWRAAGSPVVNYWMRMEDVESDAYYTEAVRWALSTGIAKGTSDTTFSPEKVCTRAEIITFIWRYSGGLCVDYAMQMDDVKSGAYYGEAVRWALATGITAGTSATTFTPDRVCTRGEAVTFIYRYCAHAPTFAAAGVSTAIQLDPRLNVIQVF